MKEKEYPMPDDYNEKAARLVGFIETRDKVRAAFKDMTSDQRRTAQESLKILNQSIESLEKYLAETYETYQKKRRLEERQERAAERGMRTVQEIYIGVKHLEPEKLETFTKILEPLSPEEREEFFDGVAILEATRLDEILTGNKS